ncbi:MAG: sugar phosphate isomerase/epimerase, partial [Clostridiales bacterium]|nr:sugar phosphate isomerase/epimerase [Clostridiales bacterium]
THISDHTKEKDCLPIGEGDFDFAKYFKKMQKYSFSGAAVIELYRSNFGQIEQLYLAYRQLELLF